MNANEFLKSLINRIRTHINVGVLCGEPIKVDNKTLIPVSKVSVSSSALNAEDDKGATPKIGDVSATPLGILEVTEHKTKFVSFDEKPKLLGALIAGLVLGILLLNRSRSGKKAAE